LEHIVKTMPSILGLHSEVFEYLIVIPVWRNCSSIGMVEDCFCRPKILKLLIEKIMSPINSRVITIPSTPVARARYIDRLDFIVAIICHGGQMRFDYKWESTEEVCSRSLYINFAGLIFLLCFESFFA